MVTTAVEIREPVIIDVSASSPNRKVNGVIENCTRKNLTLITGEETAESAAVRVQSKDLLFLGTVLRCVHGETANWTVHIDVNRTLLII